MSSPLHDAITSQVSLGSRVTFHLRDGRDISGTLTDIGLDHITLEGDSGSTSVVIEFISSWHLAEKQAAKAAKAEAPSEASGEDAAKELGEIVRRLELKPEELAIDPEPPDFRIPSGELDRRALSQVGAILQRLRDKYNYAKKVNEVESKFGRIQPISRELNTLAERFPSSVAVARHAVYFRFLSGPSKSALGDAQRLADGSGDVRDVRNLAAFALQMGESELAFRALRQSFEHSPVGDSSETWRAFIHSVEKTRQYHALASILTSRPTDERSGTLVFEATVYLLKVAGNRELATEIVRQRLSGVSRELLASRAIDRLIEGLSADEQPLSELRQDAEPPKPLPSTVAQQLEGNVYGFKTDRSYGFIRGLDGHTYFFHHSAIVDSDLLDRVHALRSGERFAVAFSYSEGPKGRVAMTIDQPRTPQQTFQLALKHAKEGYHATAIDLATQVLASEPNHLDARSALEEWQRRVREKAADTVLAPPRLSIRLAVETYLPDESGNIEAQLAVENAPGRRPAQSVELVVQEDPDMFELGDPELKRVGSLAGGESKVVRIPLRVSGLAADRRAFTFPVYAQYHNEKQIALTSVMALSIGLYGDEEFKEFANPFATYAEGGVVGDPHMFYGRGELIERLGQAIQESRTQSKSVVIFGQKRAGKSSILFHLKEWLMDSDDILVVDLGNIGLFLDESSSTPLLQKLLWEILCQLRYAIEDREESGAASLELAFPTADEFFQHPSPISCFNEMFEKFRRRTGRSADWRGIRVVLMMDEFSYVYGYIMKGAMPETFMRNWKALLQRNYFSVAMAGQDVMPKFKQRFPNEFGTTQDERVTYLNPEDATKLIDEPIRIGGRKGKSRYRERAIGRILNLTAGNPFYIQIICSLLVEYMNRKRTPVVTEADVEQVKEELIYGVNALGGDKFESLISSGDTSPDAISDDDSLAVLKAVAGNFQGGSCRRADIVCTTTAALDDVLNDLVGREVLERDPGQFYRIRVGLFREWLVAHEGFAARAPAPEADNLYA